MIEKLNFRRGERVSAVKMNELANQASRPSVDYGGVRAGGSITPIKIRDRRLTGKLIDKPMPYDARVIINESDLPVVEVYGINQDKVAVLNGQDIDYSETEPTENWTEIGGAFEEETLYWFAVRGSGDWSNPDNLTWSIIDNDDYQDPENDDIIHRLSRKLFITNGKKVNQLHRGVIDMRISEPDTAGSESDDTRSIERANIIEGQGRFRLRNFDNPSANGRITEKTFHIVLRQIANSIADIRYWDKDDFDTYIDALIESYISANYPGIEDHSQLYNLKWLDSNHTSGSTDSEAPRLIAAFFGGEDGAPKLIREDELTPIHGNLKGLDNDDHVDNVRDTEDGVSGRVSYLNLDGDEQRNAMGENAKIGDSLGHPSIYPNLRKVIDSEGNDSINWESRGLYGYDEEFIGFWGLGGVHVESDQDYYHGQLKGATTAKIASGGLVVENTDGGEIMEIQASDLQPTDKILVWRPNT